MCISNGDGFLRKFILFLLCCFFSRPRVIKKKLYLHRLTQPGLQVDEDQKIGEVTSLCVDSKKVEAWIGDQYNVRVYLSLFVTVHRYSRGYFGRHGIIR